MTLQIKKTGDPELDILAGIVQRHYRKPVKDNPHNPLRKMPRIIYLAVTDLAFPETFVWGTRGVITDENLINPRIRDRFTFVEVHVGTDEGTGVAHHSDYIPVENGLKVLEPMIEKCLKEARQQSVRSYYELLGETAYRKDAFLCRQSSIDHVVDVQEVKTRRIATDRLKAMARKASKILSKYGDDGRVRISVQDEVRKMVNSQGTVIRDFFFGYHFRFIVYSQDKEGRKMEFVQNLYFNDSYQIRKERILNFAQFIADEVNKRKDCPVITPGIYPVLYSQGAMATGLHECFAHLAASDNILTGGATVWGWENYRRQVAGHQLSVYTDPGMQGPAGLRWGSILYDYEGVPARRRPLIENGVVAGYLADRNGAFHLTEKIRGKFPEAEILPGDARFDINNTNTYFPPQPRITNLDVYWEVDANYSGIKKKPRNRAEMKRLFLHHLRKTGQNGLYIPDDSGAESVIDSAQIEAQPNFPYIVTPAGELIPTKFVTTRSYADSFTNNILVMGEPRVYTAHRCGDGEEYEACVRAGIMCGPGIVENVVVGITRREERRQPE